MINLKTGMLSLLLVSILVLFGFTAYKVSFPFFARNDQLILGFDGNRALEDAISQVNMGPRVPGSTSHQFFIQWLISRLAETEWQTRLQVGSVQGQRINNIIAINSNEPPQIIIATHYDNRLLSDNDPDPILRSYPVPGANDGASGVSILLELARVLPLNSVPVWLVFLDAEDNGNIGDMDWIMGSRFFVENLQSKPKAVVILDMVGDRELNIYREKNSDLELFNEIWESARLLDYGAFFIDVPKYSLIDDHMPFIRVGIPAVTIIDFDYPYWHTTSDTIDKISEESLTIVGSTILRWLKMQN
jgi:glutaminyl-peptide cyclotransferase